MLTLTVVACNDTKDTKKKSTTDTVVVKPVEVVPMPPVPEDTVKMCMSEKDSATKKPVKTPD